MSFLQVPAGAHVPDNINVIIEIPAHSGQVKYEVEKKSGAMFVDRFLQTSMHYPCNYGYMPQTLAEDGDPMDILVVTPYPLQIGVVVASRPIGMLRMTDEKGPDAKIVAVPIDKLTSLYAAVQKPADLSPVLLQAIEHFFIHYKDLDNDKWVQVDGWDDTRAAKAEIVASVARYNNN